MLTLTRLTIERVKKERLPQVAGSLAFTTLLSIVPVLSASFALFARFPSFHRFKDALQDFLLSRLLPVDIARTVLKYLNQFAANASGLSWIGSLFLLGAAVALLLTVENALNQMWQVKKNRPFFKRVGLYLLMLAVGPPVLGLSLWATSYLLGASMGLIGPLPRSLAFVLDLGPLLLGAMAMTSLFYFVPNTAVRLGDAIAGGLIASVAFELGKRGFTAYLVKVPTYKALYGAFAALPMFLLWVYFSWLVTLIAAMVTANLALARRRAARQ
jgi:membrane protein